MRRALLVGFTTAAAGLLLAGAYVAWQTVGGTTAGGWSRDPRQVMKPAPLSPLHEAQRQLGDCNACHALDTPIPDEKCFACHDEIRVRRTEGVGHHGRDLPGACHDCHVDHAPRLVEFDRERFNHARADFALRGRHAELRCEQCHEKRTGVPAQPRRMQFIGLAHDTCTACHTDPHEGRLVRAEGRTCVDCHDEEAWTGRHLRFAHDRDTAFPLEGRHHDVPCTGCHAPPERAALAAARFDLPKGDCAGCHTDPHRGQFTGAACATCHTDRGFDRANLRFRHEAVAAFRLEGRHADVPCAKCHVPVASPGDARFRGTPTACEGCHQGPHRGQFDGTACATCHVDRGFGGRDLRFDHRRVATFPLSGAHVTVQCGQCHRRDEALGARLFRGTSSDCATCHTEPHGGQFAGTPCAACHRDAGWTGGDLRFDHARVDRFPLTGAHAGVACAKCHTAPEAGAPVAFRGRGTDCAGCHLDPHRGSLAPRACSDCHTPAGWTGTNTRFDHTTGARFALDATHAAQPCGACHTDRVFRPRPAECAACHTAAADALAGRVEGEGALPASPHAGLLTCRGCHAPEDRGADVRAIAPRCATCHTERYVKLQFDRSALLGHRVADARRAATAEPDDARRALLLARIERLRRAAAHDFESVEPLLR